ncbi:prepilin-type N-terminal cleavage/methylation domain-containing protein [Anaerobranca californiensis DSM 14826]|uniref:Prepilin-type N-terminal cleavage/methylation domain-containing protein n=1 Tax=Anaerobranca californiensis DSM 14826 TaxID=1120989 RepID=A0A1M6LAW4_9FIRM|nr:prepilin-type N-terminal cleavage/methylation domain-containing protein [Anaerobranca californiensis]SHJ68328.1 prepilin-type N-terminal cleavage/methylation domain-containing protein [Anaerobranca californiensis DSM 14826]
MLKWFTKDNKGFTLVELLVVIAVIAILAAIAIPRFGGFRDRALEAAHKSELQALRQALNYAIIEKGDNNIDFNDLAKYFDDDEFNATNTENVTYTPGGGDGRRYTLTWVDGQQGKEITATVVNGSERENGWEYEITPTSIERKTE